MQYRTILIWFPGTAFAAFLLLALAAPATLATSTPPVTSKIGRVTGLPIPRFVSLKTDDARMRVGPGTQYKIAWVYHERGMPMEVLDEYSNWRQVRDPYGSTGWMFHTLLSGVRHALIAPWAKKPLPLFSDPRHKSPVVAKLAPSVLVRVSECNGKWCRIDVSHHAMAGYFPQTDLWGVYQGASFG